MASAQDVRRARPTAPTRNTRSVAAAPDAGPTATAQIAEFISSAQLQRIPTPAIEIAKQAILDAIGVAAAGTKTEDGAIAVGWARAQQCAPRATVIATSERTSPYLAALVNGVDIHALSFDDGNHPAYAHLTAVLLPVVLGLGEASGASGADILLAYLVGYDVEARIGGVINPTHYRKGWHAQSTLGTMGAAVAAAKMLRLPASEVRATLGIAASDASGLKRNIGTMTQPLHAGKAAAAGLRAAELAAGGFTADLDIFDGPNSYIEMFRADEPDPDYLLRGLGTAWEIMSLPSGWHPKPYPSCGGTHNTIQACLKLRELDGVRPENVDSIAIGINQMTVETCRYHTPRLGREAQFSLEFCAAIALLEGRATLADFTDEKTSDPRIRDLITRVRVSSPEEVAFHPDHATIVTVTLKDGTQRRRREDLGIGKPENPMSRVQLQEKFAGCAEGIWDTSRQRRIAELVGRLEHLADVRELARELTPS